MIYDYMIIDPLREMLAKVVGFLPTLGLTLVILIIGWTVVKFFSKILLDLFKAINLDKVIDKLGAFNVLDHGDKKPSELLSHLTYVIGMIIVLVMTVKSLGLITASDLLDSVLAYIPSVISGVFVLIIGMLIAHVISGVVHVVAKNTDMPRPELLSGLSKLTIMFFAVTAFLREVGFGDLFVGTNFTIVFGGIVLALALAFGLAGKDIAAKYLDVFKKDNYK